VFEGTVITQVDPLRIDVERTEVDVEEDDEDAPLEVDSGTRIDGFDREGDRDARAVRRDRGPRAALPRGARWPARGLDRARR
jgi:hypothetical protein